MTTNRRKIEHLDALENDSQIERHDSGFEKIQLIHRALPELNFTEINCDIKFLNKNLSLPLVISSMTGGDDERILKINQNLAIAAEECQIAMAVGSQRVMFENPRAAKSFDLRSFAPTTVLLGNIGAVQLNRGFGVLECSRAVEILCADGLYLHLNPLQEAIQTEGDRDFSGLVKKIGVVNRELPVPVLLKEVGAGLSPPDVELAKREGIHFFDVAGRGGTSWSRIEAYRNREDIGYLFQDWGLKTADLLPLLTNAHPDKYFIASGGIRNGIDMAKAIILGAELVGAAMPFLAAAQESATAVIHVIKRFEREFKTALFLLGCQNVAALKNNKSLIMNH